MTETSVWVWPDKHAAGTCIESLDLAVVYSGRDCVALERLQVEPPVSY